MTVRFFPYISFPGNGTEVMTYYQEIFGGELTITKYGEFSAEKSEEFPFPLDPEALAHSQLEAGDIRLTGGDAIGEDVPPLDSDVYSFILAAESKDEAEALISKFISTGAEEIMPFELAPWGDFYGQIRDRFGVVWAFNVAGER